MSDDWGEAAAERRADPGEAFIVDVGGFEGPLDLLLMLARDQKVDLTRISILALSEQYSTFIDQARRLSLELAADYLVMAAWLAYLKSRLLLPEKDEDDEPTGDELASVLAFRLRRLEAMRRAGEQLVERPRLGLDVFARGMPEIVSTRTDVTFAASLYELLAAYSAQRARRLVRTISLPKRTVLTLQDARERLTRMLGMAANWTPLDAFLSDYLRQPGLATTARASALSASLEMVKEGEIELRQLAPFAPLYLRRYPGSDRGRGMA